MTTLLNYLYGDHSYPKNMGFKIVVLVARVHLELNDVPKTNGKYCTRCTPLPDQIVITLCLPF